MGLLGFGKPVKWRSAKALNPWRRRRCRPPNGSPAPVAGPERRLTGELQRLERLAHRQVPLGDLPAGQVDLDRVEQSHNVDGPQLSGGLVGLPVPDQLVDSLAPGLDQHLLPVGALPRAAIADLVDLLALLAGAGEIACHRPGRCRGTLRAALARQAVDPVGARKVAIVLEPGAQLLEGRAIGIGVHVALLLHMAEQQRIAQPRDQAVGTLPVAGGLMGEDLPVTRHVGRAQRAINDLGRLGDLGAKRARLVGCRRSGDRNRQSQGARESRNPAPRLARVCDHADNTASILYKMEVNRFISINA